MFVRDYLFDNSDFNALNVSNELFDTPASIEIRQAPVYPQRELSPSGPSAPSQEPPHHQVIVHRDPSPTDSYHEHHESSDIPETLRHPERSFRAPPLNDNTSIAVQSGIASDIVQVSSDNSQTFQREVIQGGGEFMPGIFANDTYNDTSYSTF